MTPGGPSQASPQGGRRVPPEIHPPPDPMLMRKPLYSLTLAALTAASLAACTTSAVTGPTVTPAPVAAAAAPSATPQVHREALAQGLYELAYSPRQDALFVASAGGRGEGAAPARILRLDPATLAVRSETPLERKGFGLVLDDAADRLYIGNTVDGSITVMDTASGKVLGTVQLVQKVTMTGPDGKETQRYPHSFREMVLDTKQGRLFAPGLGNDDSSLYVVDTKTLKVEKVLPGFGFVATGITLDAAAGKVYVSNFQGQLYTVDTQTLTVQRKAEVEGDQLVNLFYDGKAGRILAADQGLPQIDGMRGKARGLTDYRRRGDGNQIVVINPADGQTVAKVPTGLGALSLLVDDQRGRLFVANRRAGTVTIHDSSDHRLLHTVALASHPNSLSLDPKTGAVYVSIKNGEADPKGSNESIARIVF